MLHEHYKIGTRVRAVKNNIEIIGIISKDLREMSYEIAQDNGDLKMVDHGNIQEILNNKNEDKIMTTTILNEVLINIEKQIDNLNFMIADGILTLKESSRQGNLLRDLRNLVIDNMTEEENKQRG